MHSNNVNRISCSFSFSKNSKEVIPSKLDFGSFKQLTNDRTSIILPKEDREYTIKVVYIYSKQEGKIYKDSLISKSSFPTLTFYHTSQMIVSRYATNNLQYFLTSDKGIIFEI